MSRLLPLTAILFGALSVQTCPAATVRSTVRPVGERTPAPPLSLPDASGKLVRLPDYRGKVVLLNFWATECGGCRLELPSFVQLASGYKNQPFAIVGISLDLSYEELKDAGEAWNKVNPFVKAHGLNYAILMGDAHVEKLYNTEALPLTVLVDASGRIAATYVGIIDKADVDANIKLLLKEH